MTQRNDTALPLDDERNGSTQRLPTLYDDLEGTPVVSPDADSITRFAPYVPIRPETRSAAIALIDAVWDWIETMTADGEAEDDEMVAAATRFFNA